MNAAQVDIAGAAGVCAGIILAVVTVYKGYRVWHFWAGFPVAFLLCFGTLFWAAGQGGF